LIAENYIEKYDAVTYEKVGRMYSGQSPAHIVITPDGNTGYFSNFDITELEKNIKVFDTHTMTITNTISDLRMRQPHGLRLNHNNNLIIMTTYASEFLYMIEPSNNQIEDIVPVDPTVPLNGTGTSNFKPYQTAITPDDRYAFVSCSVSNDVRVFDIQTREFVHIIPVGLKPLALEISPDGNWCYVPNRNSNSVSVINIHTMSVAKTISNVGAQPHMVDFTEDGHYVYVSCESQSGTFAHHPPIGSQKPGTTAVIDVWAGHVKVKDIEMASFPAGISITPGKGN
jgi:YVTN family beta-propeller protein